MSVPSTHLQSECMSARVLNTTLEEKLKRAWEITKGLGMTITGVKTCGDYMFSGHTSMLTLLNFFINEVSDHCFFLTSLLLVHSHGMGRSKNFDVGFKYFWNVFCIGRT